MREHIESPSQNYDGVTTPKIVIDEEILNNNLIFIHLE